jgi:hypothetical protein
MAQNNLTLPQALNKLTYAKKQKAFAWAKYYETVNDRLHDAHQNYDTFNRVADDKSIPEHIKKEMREMATALKKQWECPVCIEMIADEALEITNCGHYYCKTCLDSWKKTCKDRGDAKWKCSMCNRAHGYGTE